MRSLPEWIGKTDDERPPTRVRVRVFDAYGGKCWLTGRKIQVGDEWDLDHKLALINGGENREANLAPALRFAHRIKTAADVGQKAALATARAKHIGARNKGPRSIKGRGFPKREKTRWRSASELARMNSGDPR